MIVAGRRILICSCEDSMTIDGPALAAALGAAALGADSPPAVHRHLCRSDMAVVEQALADDAPLLIACAQEAPLFHELAAELDVAPPLCVDLRDRAGWSADPQPATAKMAALLADALTPTAGPDNVALSSAGRIVVLGEDDRALALAARLGASRGVICLLTASAADMVPPRTRPFVIMTGAVRQVRGRLGDFVLTIDRPAGLAASARATLAFEPPGPPQEIAADIILDLRRGAAPLWADRVGYLRCDPGDAVGVETALARALALKGDFPTPRYLRVAPTLCVHARAQQIACTRCMDACPTSAITPDGDRVQVDPTICAGHGACVSACPTGALQFDSPADNGIYRRLKALLATYAGSGGVHPLVLAHESPHGEEIITAMARFGDGLPAYVLPFAVPSVAALGLEFQLTAAAWGAARLTLLADDRRPADLAPVLAAAQTANAVLSGLGWGVRADLLCTSDPDAVAAALALTGPVAIPPAASYLVLGDKRSTLNLALGHLRRHAPAAVDEILLPAGAPFGDVRVDADRCTLCLSCVGVCPTGALSQSDDPPTLGFTGAACVQCGLCRVACPEKAVTLTPLLDLRPAARLRRVVKQDAPHACPACGKIFASQSSIAMLTARLADHPLFAGTGRLGLLQLCEDCRGDPQQINGR